MHSDPNLSAFRSKENLFSCKGKNLSQIFPPMYKREATYYNSVTTLFNGIYCHTFFFFPLFFFFFFPLLACFYTSVVFCTWIPNHDNQANVATFISAYECSKYYFLDLYSLLYLFLPSLFKSTRKIVHIQN